MFKFLKSCRLWVVFGHIISFTVNNFLPGIVSNIPPFINVPFRGLRAIGNGCKKLKNLTLSDCYFLSDKGLEAIATGCKELTHLEVNGCHNIGTLGLESVGKSCKYVFI